MAENLVGWDSIENLNQNQQKKVDSRDLQRNVTFGGTQDPQNKEGASVFRVGHLESQTQEATSLLRPKLERKCKPDNYPIVKLVIIQVVDWLSRHVVYNFMYE